MKRRWLAGALTLFLLLATMPVYHAADRVADGAARVQEILDLLSRNHVSGVSVKALEDGAIRGMLAVLKDPYTQYFTDEEWERFRQAVENEFVGIGITVRQEGARFFVERVVPQSPAAAGGLEVGDEIVAVDGKAASALSFEEFLARVRGPEGTAVTLTLRRGGRLLAPVTLTRKRIHLPDVEFTRMEGNIGYIRLATFGTQTGQAFANALRLLKQPPGMRALILDLRGNGGGLLETARQIAAQFFPEGVLMYTKNRYGLEEAEWVRGGTAIGVPVMVLVDQGSASASEVLAGALRDNLPQHVKLIGTRTFGKGSVQNVVELKNGGVLKVTIEEYMTPKKRPVNHVGLQPDRVATGALAPVVAALREVQADAIRVVFTPERATVNNAPIFAGKDGLVEGGRWYVRDALLAELVGGQASWDAKRRAVTLAKGERRLVLPAGDRRLRDAGGLLYVEVAAFARVFPELRVVKADGRTLELRVQLNR